MWARNLEADPKADADAACTSGRRRGVRMDETSVALDRIDLVKARLIDPAGALEPVSARDSALDALAAWVTALEMRKTIARPSDVADPEDD